MGKVVGLDSKSGRTVWKLVFPGGPSSDLETKLFVQRGPSHFGLDARCALVYSNSRTGIPELLTFNPMDGSVVSGPRQFGSDFTQAVMIHHTIEDHIKCVQ